MSAPRLEVRLDRLRGNARTLVQRLGAVGIGVTGVTKATMGSPEVARALLAAGVTGLGDSRIENVEALRRAGVHAPITLLRSPMPSQVDRVVASATTSCNTELDVVAALDRAAATRGVRHGVVLMVELGDLREGILPADLVAVARRVAALAAVDLVGIGTNLACQSGVAPDDRNMAELSALAGVVEADLGVRLGRVSGGNSANLGWVERHPDVGRIDDLRLGEAILLGCEPLHRRPLDGLRTDAITLVGEVIEAKVKPSQPWGEVGQAAFGAVPAVLDRGERCRVVVALGHQDVDPAGLVPPPGTAVLGASSDHLVLDPGTSASAVGSEVRFGLDYAALVRAMTSPFVSRSYLDADADADADADVQRAGRAP